MRPSLPKAKVLIAVALAAGFASGLTGCAKKAGEDAKAQARTVTVVTVSPRSIEGGLVASGSLVPREDVAVFPQISGYRVARVLADEGMWVRAGQPLAVMDDVLLRAQVAQQNAQASQQKILADQADAQAARVKGALADGLLSQEQIDGRRYAARSARAQANAAEAAATDVRTREALMTVRAPFSGLVIERNIRIGDMSSSANPWYRLARDGQVELAADVSESNLNAIHPGGRAVVTLVDGSRVQGVVRLVSPRIDAATKLGRVRISLPVQANVRAGGFARASFLGVTRSAVAVPETAVRYDADGASVLAVGADSKVARVAVTTGQRGGGFVELLTGPADGARVVERAASMLTPGDFVKPVLAQ